MSWDPEEATPATPDQDIPSAYPDVVAFVAEYLAPTYRRALGGERVWCSRWHEHAEASERLEALWRAWEHLHEKPTGPVDWWLRYCDPTMAVLLSADGPFRYCGAGHSDQLGPLPTD